MRRVRRHRVRPESRGAEGVAVHTVPCAASPTGATCESAAPRGIDDLIGDDLVFASPGWVHALGNSLQAAGFHLEVLKVRLGNGHGRPDTQAALVVLEDQLERINRLVAAWAQLCMPLSSPDTAFDLAEFLNDLALLVSATVRHRGFNFEYERPETSWLVEGHRFGLLHASLRVLRCTLDSMPSHGTLGLSASATEEGRVRIRLAGTPGPMRSQADGEFLTLESGGPAAVTDADLRSAVWAIEQNGGRLSAFEPAGGGKAFHIDLPLSSGSCGENGSR